jgi:hypothetical protein
MKYDVLLCFTYQRYGPLTEVAVGIVLLVVKVRVHGNTLLGRPEKQTGIKYISKMVKKRQSYSCNMPWRPIGL